MKKFLRKMKKALSIMLVLSMIFTSHAFVTFAENVGNNEETTEYVEPTQEETLVGEDETREDEFEIEPTEESTKEQLDKAGNDDNEGESDENVGESDENVGASETLVGESSTSPDEIVEPEAEESEVDETDYPEEPEEDETDYPEEPEEDETETLVEESETLVGESSTSPEDETSDLVGASETLVGASSTSPEEEIEIEEESLNPEEVSGAVGHLFGAQVLQSIDIQYVPRDYDIGDHYDPSGLVVTPTYQEEGTAGLGDRGTPVEYDEHPECFSFSPDYVNSLTFTTRGHVNMDIIFTDAEGRKKSAGNTLTIGTITNIAITTSPKTSYRVGEDFDPTGLVVTATWKNGETEEVSYATKPSNFMALGDTTNLQESNTYVEYLVKVIEDIDRPVRIPITVTDKSVTSFTIGTQPTKRTYTVGETFDPAGLVANVTYDDGSNGTLSYASDASKFSFDPSLTTALTTSHTQVKVTIGSAHQNIPITVTKTINSIAVKSSNTTTIAISDDFSSFSNPFISNGERFDPNGMVIKVTYNDGSTAEVTYNNTTSSQFTINYNAASVDIEYGGKSVTYNFSVSSEPCLYIYFHDNTNVKRAMGVYDTDYVSKIEDLYNYVSSGRELGFYVINATGLQDAYNKYNANATATMTLTEAMAEAQNITSVSPMTQYTFWGVTNRSKSQGGGTITPGGTNFSGGGDGGGSSSGASDPTKGPMGDLTKSLDAIRTWINEQINTSNDIPQSSLLKDDSLASYLKSSSENINRPYTNAQDENGNRGYGQWLRVPNTTTWYFFSGDLSQVNGQSSGFLANGWYNLGWDGQEKWYYFDANGVMKIGWHVIGGKMYYLDSNLSYNWYGSRTTGTKVIDGISYNFTDKGELDTANGGETFNFTQPTSNQNEVHFYGGELSGPDMMAPKILIN